ncbi:MAG: hypothetical protein ACOYMX_04180, partial [Burkholderiales bacterium]
MGAVGWRFAAAGIISGSNGSVIQKSGGEMAAKFTLKGKWVSLGVAASALMAAQSAMAVDVQVEVFQKSKNPWGMAFLKDGTFFFTEKCDGLSVRLPS